MLVSESVVVVSDKLYARKKACTLYKLQAACMQVTRQKCTILCVTISLQGKVTIHGDLVAEPLSMRHIIVWARRVLVGSLFEAVLVCLSITGLQLKYSGTPLFQTSVIWTSRSNGRFAL